MATPGSRVWWTAGFVAFAALVPILRQVPNAATDFEPMPWSHAALHAVVLGGLMALHCRCYQAWYPGGPGRIHTNELLTRAWFALFGLLIVAGHGGRVAGYAVGATAWVLATFLVHRRLVKSSGHYDAAPNFALLGLFLVGNALLGLYGVEIIG